MSIRRELKLGECCTKYAMALVDPWCLADSVGIPAEVSLPSYKCTIRCRGITTVGSDGCGYVVANPFSPINDGGTISPIFAPVHITTSAYSGIDYKFSTTSYALANGVAPQWCDSPFSLPQFQVNTTNPGAALKARVVGAGIKIRYVGSEFQRAGRVIAYRSPMNLPIIAAAVTGTPVVTQSELLRNKETSTVPVDRQTHCAIYRPAVPTDLSYGEADDMNIPLGNYPRRMVDGPSLLMFITGSTAGQTFEYDYVAHYELIGTNLPGFTITSPDPVGMAAIGAANSVAQPTTNVEENTKSFMSRINHHLSQATHVLEQVTPVVEHVKKVASGVATVRNLARTAKLIHG